jgi:hypothetical protein
MSIMTARAALARNMQQSAEARAEDLAWMADTGETVTGAAKRLGISVETLEKWCARHGQMAVYRRLASHEDVPTWRPSSYDRRRRRVC